jgi:hypothetical protein
MNNFNTNIKEWGEKVVSYCQEVATNSNYDMDLSFYAFQSPPKEKPDLLILGINPAGEYTYSDLYNYPAWGLTVEKQMTAEVFVKSNPFFHNHETWALWKNLSKSFNEDRMKRMLINSMYMNFICFNTPNINILLKKKHGREIFSKCRDFSLELISDIIKPKQILCLGTGACFDILPITNKECLLNYNKRLLMKGELSNIPIYGIPHPSGSRTSNVHRNKIGEILNNNFC